MLWNFCAAGRSLDSVYLRMCLLVFSTFFHFLMYNNWSYALSSVSGTFTICILFLMCGNSIVEFTFLLQYYFIYVFKGLELQVISVFLYVVCGLSLL